MPASKFVGLTGGIGAGKSTALAALARLGAATLSTDAVVHELYTADASVRSSVVERFGDGVLGEDGTVDRKALAAAAFATPEDREWLEQLIWPLVGARVWAFRQEAEGVAVVETPLLFEAGMDGAYDATIAVVAPEEVRAARAAARGHAAVDERTARQLTQDEKAQRADFAVTNDGTEDDLQQELSVVLAKITGQ